MRLHYHYASYRTIVLFAGAGLVLPEPVVQTIRDLAPRIRCHLHEERDRLYLAAHSILDFRHVVTCLRRRGLNVIRYRQTVDVPGAPGHSVAISIPGPVALCNHTREDVNAEIALSVLGVETCPCIRLLLDCVATARGDDRTDRYASDLGYVLTLIRDCGSAVRYVRTRRAPQPWGTFTDRAARLLARIIRDLIDSGAVHLPSRRLFSRPAHTNVVVEFVKPGNADISMSIYHPPQSAWTQREWTRSLDYIVRIPTSWISLYKRGDHIISYKGAPALVLERTNGIITAAVLRQPFSVQKVIINE